MHVKNPGKLKIIPLKFGSVWILYSKISEFEFYPLNFGCLDFIPRRFRIWILPSKVWKCLDLNSETLGYKIQTPLKFKG